MAEETKEAQRDVGSNRWFASQDYSEEGANDLFNERLQRVEDCIALKPVDRVPIVPFLGTLPYNLYGSSYRDSMYNYEKAGQAMIRYYKDYHPDASVGAAFSSGRAQELSGIQIIDWPGRPGGTVPDYSIYQVTEREFMMADEYHEFIHDFTGFMLNKYLPRVYKNLGGLSKINLFTTRLMSASDGLATLYDSEVIEAFKLLEKIGDADREAAAAAAKVSAEITKMGYPPMMTGGGQAPFDVLGDYFRGTVAILEDQIDYEDEIIEACDVIADREIQKFQYFKTAKLPCKRVFFPLHKGMDTFMSPKQYAEMYWKPLKKVVMALIDMGVTPYLYTEGAYNTRLETIADVPEGKVLYHFENTDMKRAKEVLGGIACIDGNLPLYVLEYGTPDDVREACARLLDDAMDGYGYIFNTAAGVDNASRENMDAMYETLMEYGVY